LQRAVVEGSLALLLQCSCWVDLQKAGDPDQARRCALLLDLLTPVAKTYPSEMGIVAISNGLQCFGGSGYCDDYPLEQYYRDVRIHPIHEGTTAIHGLDLLGRKVVMHNGAALALFNEQVGSTIAKAEGLDALAAHARQLAEALERLNSVTAHLVGRMVSQGPAHGLADATLFLELFGIVTIAWQWLGQGLAACRGLERAASPADKDFYTGKLHAMAYFFGYELPKTLGLAQVLTADLHITIDMDNRHFSD